MRYTNPRFTYLLTYIAGVIPSRCSRTFLPCYKLVVLGVNSVWFVIQQQNRGCMGVSERTPSRVQGQNI